MDCEALTEYLAQLLQYRKDRVVPPQLTTMLTTGACTQQHDQHVWCSASQTVHLCHVL
jgi:hypothetical protein